jgi:hypothetical protein
VKGQRFLVGAVLLAGAAVGAAVILPDRGGIVLALAAFVALALFAPALTTSEDRSWLPPLLLGAYGAKLAASGGAYWVILNIYNGKGDAVGYHIRALLAADAWRSLAFPQTDGFRGTDFADLAISLVYVPYEPSMLGGFFIFATLGFVGQLFFYAAFRHALSGPRLKWYAAAIFFYPSIIYWTATIGKEALIFLFMGPITYGIARLLGGFRLRWLVVIALGLLSTALLRPHIALLLGGAVLVAVGASRLRPREAGWRRLVVTTFLLLSASALVVFAARAFNIEGTGNLLQEGVDPFLTDLESKTQTGGSAVEGGFIRNPADSPAAIFRVLFRPLPHEATNAPTLVTGLEGVVLLLLCLWRTPEMFRGLLQVRRQPYVVFALVFTVGFTVAFSAILNLGLLARQRSQVLPFLFVLLIELRRAKVQERSTPAREEAPRVAELATV